MRKIQAILLALGLLFLSVSWSSTHAFSLADSAQILPDADTLYACAGVALQLSATDADSFSWAPAQDFDDASAQNVMLTPSADQWYFLTVIVNGIACTDSVFVMSVVPTFGVSVSTTDTICPGTSVTVQFNSNAPISDISWDPEDGITDLAATDSTIIKPFETTEFVVTAMIGNCELTDTFTIDVVPFVLRNNDGDTLFLCKPDTGMIQLQLQPSNLTVTWDSLDGYIEPNPARPDLASVFPEITTNYTASATYLGCFLSATTHVRVDSLPDNLQLTIFNPKDPYCSGDSIYIIGTNVDTAKYPDLEFLWTPLDGQIQNPTDAGNVRVILNDTTNFTRTLDNNACVDSFSVLVNVIPPEIPLSVNDTMLCPGQEFDVEVLDKTVEDIEWMPEEGLSCTECFEPTVTVLPMPMTYMVSGMKEGCPVGAELNVQPLAPVGIPVSPPAAIGCENTMVELSIDTTGLMNLRLAVIEGEAGLSCTDCANPVVTITGSAAIGVAADIPDSLGCGAFTRIPVAIGAPEPVSFTEFVCPNEPTVLDLTIYGFENPSVDLNGLGSCSGSPDCLMPTVTIGNAPGQIFVESDDSNPGFCGTFTTINLQPLLPDDAVILPLDSMPFGRGQIITVELVPPGGSGSNYEWTVNGSPIGDNSSQAMVELTEGGQNTVSVAFTNLSGCLQVVNATFFAEEPEINVPNAFTPNGDDANDRFRVQIIGGAELDEMLIFNRWGQVVYEGADPNGWDGNFDGEAAPTEVYTYVIRLRLPNGDIGELKGDVTLIR